MASLSRPESESPDTEILHLVTQRLEVWGYTEQSLPPQALKPLIVGSPPARTWNAIAPDF